MSIENQFDPIDIRIIKELTADAGIPLIQLAKKLNVSNTLVHQRLRKMKKAGVLTKPTYQLDAWALGYLTSAFIQIMLSDSKHQRTVVEKLANIPEIVECVNIAGRYALMVKIFAKDNRHLRDIIYERIHTLEWVEGTSTIFVFETYFSRNIPVTGGGHSI